MCTNTFDQSVELYGLLNRQLREDSIVLRAVANQHSCLLELFLDVIALYCDLASCRLRFSRQTLESGRFSRPINSQQGKALAIIQAKRSLFDSSDGCTAECIIFLLEVVHSDAFDLGRISGFVFLGMVCS